jgi:hypothetical protein
LGEDSCRSLLRGRNDELTKKGSGPVQEELLEWGRRPRQQKRTMLAMSKGMNRRPRMYSPPENPLALQRVASHSRGDLIARRMRMGREGGFSLCFCWPLPYICFSFSAIAQGLLRSTGWVETSRPFAPGVPLVWGGEGYSERRLCIDRKLPTSWGWAGEGKESWINQRACVDAVSQKERDPRGC